MKKTFNKLEEYGLSKKQIKELITILALDISILITTEISNSMLSCKVIKNKLLEKLNTK